MLEELLGGGHSSPPSNSNNTQQTTSPSSPAASEPTTDTNEPAEDDTVEDDMPVDHDDGTYSPAPVAENTSPEEVEPHEPAAEPVASEPVASDEDYETAMPSPEPVATAPAENDDADEDTANEAPATPQPAATAPSQPAPSTGTTQPDEVVDDIATAPAASATRSDPVTRITDLVASYEKLLSEAPVNSTEQARTRAMELAQNRVLTSLLGDLSTSDARLALLDDDNAQSGEVSLINKYYAETG